MAVEPAQKRSKQWLSAGECASRTGLTVRALRVYESKGLIQPDRTPKGWRRYNLVDLSRLSTIAVLRSLGLTLLQIRRILTKNAPSLDHVLRLHADSLKVRLTATEHALQITGVVQRRLQTGPPLSIYDLSDLIKTLHTSWSTDISAAATMMRDLINEIITPEEERAWVAWWTSHPSATAENKLFREEQTQLMAEFGRLAAQGAEPSAAEAEKLLIQYNDLLSRYHVREQTVQLMDWNGPLTAKWYRLGRTLRERQPDDEPSSGKLRHASNAKGYGLFATASEAASWNQTIRDVLTGVGALLKTNPDIDPCSAPAQELARQFIGVCETYGLGDPYIYTKWAPFMAGINENNTLGAPHERAWLFLARALGTSNQATSSI